MSANTTCEFACGYESGDLLEWGWHNSVTPPGGILTTPVPSPPSGVTVGTYCAEYGGAGDIRWITAMPAGAMGWLWRPKTNPTIISGVPAHIFAIDNGALAGLVVGWDTNKKLVVTDMNFGAETVYATSANAYDATSPAWYYLVFRWDKEHGNYWLRVYEDTTSWVVKETLHFKTGVFQAQSVIALRVGQLAGTTSSAWYADNWYLMRRGGLWPPPNPNFASGTVTDVSGNSTLWVYQSVAAYSPVVTLNANIDATQTTLVYTSTGDPILVGHVIQVSGGERMHVGAVNTTTNTPPGLTRGYEGTTATTHTAGATIERVGIDDAATEQQHIDEMSPNDSDYLKVTPLTTSAIQYFNLTN